MELELKDTEGKVVGEVSVSDSLFGVPFNSPLVHQAMVMYNANLRQGTHSTKTRSQVSGGGAKPWRQKHTGRARQGSIRSPQWRHGGIVFGPKPRSYRLDMPKRMRRLALKCVLSQKVRDERLILIDTLDSLEGRTKAMVRALSNLEIAGSTLIVTGGTHRNVTQAAHNLVKVWTLPVALLNAGMLLKYNTVLMTLDALRQAEEIWLHNPGNTTSSPTLTKSKPSTLSATQTGEPNSGSQGADLGASPESPPSGSLASEDTSLDDAAAGEQV